MANHAIDVTDDTFASTVLESDKPVLVDFWGTHCGPCKMLAPVIDEIARDHGENLTVVKVNVEENPAIARDLQIMAVPTMIVYFGGEPVQTIRGAKSKAFILRELGSVIGTD
ncbi:MAG: thioredoxin [Gordonia sp. (in: high G+C Gram-positive bacteria)]|uniref:thioredoxin n=1 Tax=Gordonia sp. (in: high G+C Gram-positive bacteria) TaxID=84139 RepID=UPI003BB6B2EA